MAWLDLDDFSFLATRTTADKYSAADINSVDDNLTQMRDNLNLIIGGNTQPTQSLATMQAAWTAWTPTWNNITVGSATNEGAYIQIGKTVFFRAAIGLAADSSVGGIIQLTLPVTAATYSGSIGLVNITDANVSVYYRGIIQISGQLQVMNCSATYAYQAAVNATTPITFTTSDSITVTGCYEAA